MKKQNAAILGIVLFAAFFYLIYRFKSLTDNKHPEVTNKNQQSQIQIQDNLKTSINDIDQTAHVTEKELSSENQEKINILDEILVSKNDNDSRIDTRLNKLDREIKLYLTKRYSKLKKELRNEKGTIVFLIGRSLTAAEDVRFLKEVLNESPCLSMSDCGIDIKTDSGTEEHASAGIEVSLNYPQMVALQSIENYYEKNKPIQDKTIKSEILDALESAVKSNVNIVSKKAKDILIKIKDNS